MGLLGWGLGLLAANAVAKGVGNYLADDLLNTFSNICNEVVRAKNNYENNPSPVNSDNYELAYNKLMTYLDEYHVNLSGAVEIKYRNAQSAYKNNPTDSNYNNLQSAKIMLMFLKNYESL